MTYHQIALTTLISLIMAFYVGLLLPPLNVAWRWQLIYWLSVTASLLVVLNMVSQTPLLDHA